MTIERDDGREQTWHIVGEDEADPAAGSLAYVAPLARVLMGRRLGDTVELAGSGVEITNIAAGKQPAPSA